MKKDETIVKICAAFVLPTLSPAAFVALSHCLLFLHCRLNLNKSL